MNLGLIKTYDAGAAINPYRIVKFDTSDGAVIQSAAVGDALIGATSLLGAASGERVDVVHSGIAKIKAGGTITRGAPVTSDSTGQAVAAAPSAGVNNSIIGFALVSAVSGDIFDVLLSPGKVQG